MYVGHGRSQASHDFLGTWIEEGKELYICIITRKFGFFCLHGSSKNVSIHLHVRSESWQVLPLEIIMYRFVLDRIWNRRFDKRGGRDDCTMSRPWVRGLVKISEPYDSPSATRKLQAKYNYVICSPRCTHRRGGKDIYGFKLISASPELGRLLTKEQKIATELATFLPEDCKLRDIAKQRTGPIPTHVDRGTILLGSYCCKLTVEGSN
jgi:hypothetical protein